MKNRRAQNKIDYIVFNDPAKASALLDSFDYISPKNPIHLALAIREFVHAEGRKAIEALLKIHPDRVAILKTAENHYKCSQCQRRIDGKEKICQQCSELLTAKSDNFLSENLGDKQDSDQLKSKLELLMKVYGQNPDDSELAKEIQQTWNELRGREDKLSMNKDKDQKLIRKQFLTTWLDAIFFMGFVLFAGYMMSKKSIEK